MSGFSTTLNQLCAGTASLDAALAAFHREPPSDWNAFLRHSMSIESAWRAGKIDRASYEALRNAVLTKTSALASPRENSSAVPTEHDVILPSWSPLIGPVTPGDEVRAERARSKEDSTRRRAGGKSVPGKITAFDSKATDLRSEPSSPSASFGQITNPSQWPYGPPKSVGPGTILKERFVLEEVIGRGGMGTIYRARDLRKQEAQDRHPYVAVKVLNEDFRKHPEALKALQRESRKAQALAHPNVASVFDFDRDGPLVFLVMELLEGVSLDQFIKSRVGHPLPQHEALRIVRALSAALAHAHQKELVHADFKPANAFRTEDGSVKVLDFGIARAIGRRTQEVDLTMFDPATLGALTPCYASPEMLVGDPPDPRDDVYALACVSYELFCSRHPFNFTSSLLAERGGMKPAPIPGLDRHIWRALLHGLAFSRANRTPSVEAFLAEIAPPRRFWIAATAAAVAATMIAIGIVSWRLVPEYLSNREHGRFTTQLRSGDAKVIDALLPRLLELPLPQLRTLFGDRTTREALLDHMERKIQFAIDATHERVDYDAAVHYLDQLDVLLPDSSRVARLRADVETKKQQTLATYVAAIPQQIKQGWMIDAQNSDNVLRTIAKVRQIDPQWQPDRAVLGAGFIAQIRRALYVKGDATLAGELLNAAKRIVPEVPELVSLESQVAQRMAAAARSAAAPKVASAPATIAPDGSLNLAQRKERLLALAAANDLPEALALFNGLKGELPADDAFLTADAPNALASMYIRLSSRASESGEFESAAALLARADEFTPDAPRITARRESADRLARLAHTIDNVLSISPESLTADLEHIQLDDAKRYPVIRTQLAEAFARRVVELQPTSPQRANTLLLVGKRVFPESSAIEKLQPADASTGVASAEPVGATPLPTGTEAVAGKRE
jgi:serine/threonine protein kinase